MYNNPYFNSQYGKFLTEQQYAQPTNMQYVAPIQQPIMNKSTMLQGKSVDSIDVVKAMEIPLDGSTSYFPLADGSSIITKKLKNDGTTEIIIYKPYIEEIKEEKPNYIEKGDFKIALKEFKEELIESISEEIQNLKEEIIILKEKSKK